MNETPLELNTFCGSATLLARGRNSHDGDDGFQDLGYEWSVTGDGGEAVIPAHTRQFKDTHVVFTTSGEYQVRLVVNDGIDSAETTIEVLVSDEFDFNAAPNIFIETSPEPPEVELQDGFASIVLDGSLSDTGTDGCTQTLEFRWRTVSGPGEVVLTSATDPVTQAQFSFPGFYEIELLIDDGGVFDNETRADLEYPHLRAGGRTDCDVAICTPLHGSQPTLQKAADESGFSAKQYEKIKRAHYAKAGLHNVAGATLFPLILEQGGRMGSATKAFLRLLAEYGEATGWAPR